MNKEYRKNKRVKPCFRIDVVDFMTGNNMGNLLNISRDGLLLESHNNIEKGDVYQTIWQIDASGYSNIAIGLECLWTDTTHGEIEFCGLHIIDISDTDQKALDQIISQSEEI